MKWIIGLICLYFLVIFHEFGHFIASKLCGVKVESFSVGYGPVLFHKTIKGTDFRFSLLPLGGYCGLKGSKDFELSLEQKLSEITGDKDSLYGVHSIKRALIGFSGPLFNFIFAIIAYSIICGIGYTYYSYSNKIIINDEVIENSVSNAKDAGLLSGDKIIQINKTSIENFNDIIKEVSSNPGEILEIKVLRNNEVLDFCVPCHMNKETGSGQIGISADTSEVLSFETQHYNFFGAIIQGTKDSVNYARLTIKGIGLLFKGTDLKNSVSGPIRVTEMLGSSVKEGFSASVKIGIISTLQLMGIISISLFIMNLLPVPVLDGGLILIALIETIFRKKIKPTVQYYIQFIGVAFIAFLLVIGVSGDISYLLSKRGK